MKLDAIHHITCITANGPDNADFYVGVLGLRLVKKTVNFDVPDAYHLYYGDDLGNPGSIFTFFEYPNAARGRPGAGMIHRISWRVQTEAALDFWAGRLTSSGIEVDQADGALRFSDPEGLGHELVVDASGNPPSAATAESIPTENRIIGLDGVRAYALDPGASERLLVKTLGFTSQSGGEHSIKGDTRSASYSLGTAPEVPGIQGAGTVHHIAWACTPQDQVRWRELVGEAGFSVTEILDRKYFTSIYFREPSGVLFEIATIGPGFTVDEPAETLGEDLQLPSWHEALRARLERTLTPIRAANPGELRRTA
jgi:glyoxalase family protein